MSASTKKSWWITQPGALMNAPGGGALTGLAGMLIGVPTLVYALTLGIDALGTPEPVFAVFEWVGALIVGAVGVSLTSFGERSFAGAFRGRGGLSAGRVAVALRTSLAAALLLGVGAALVHILGRRTIQGSITGDQTSDGVALAMMGLLAMLTVAVPLSRQLVRWGGLPWRRSVIAWAGVTALSLAVALAMTMYACLSQGTVDSLLLNGRWMLWTLVGGATALLMAASVRKQLSIWDGADRWRDATLTPDLRLIFADGSGSRSASSHFNGYAGPVVVMPTAAEAGAVFRGDGAPADGWVVPGTRAALEEAVRCARAMAAVTVAAVALVATAPLAVWLVSLIG